ncbi:MAG: hypothetical protein AAF849_01430 [Bacteroidota bacterium]
MKNLDQYKSQEAMSEQELEASSRVFIQAKFDEAKKASWADQLEKKYQTERTTTAKIRSIPFRAIAVAASIVLLLALLPVLGLFRDSTEDLLAAYTVENPYPNQLIRKSAETTLAELRVSAAEAYNQQQYALAIQEYQKLLQDKQANVEDLLYLGLSQIYEKQSADAVATLEKAVLQSKQEQRFEQEIDWFLALAYLQNEEVGKAKRLLEKIVANQAWRAADAEKLLNSMT